MAAAHDFFLANIAVVDGVIRLICRRQHLPPEQAEEFRSLAYLKIIQDDYQVLRRFAQRSSLRTYLVVVLQRALLDYRASRAGRWQPLVADDVLMQMADDSPLPDDMVERSRLRGRATHAQRAIREAMAGLHPADQLLLTLRFYQGMKIADIARTLRVEQKPLYRRVELLLARLRDSVEELGLRTETAGELLEQPWSDLVDDRTRTAAAV
jgi:RNA polymerase sigma factor (sigma-70 family)